MFNNINHRIRPFIYAAIILGIGWLLFFCFGCNPLTKIERDDNKAVNRVNASAPLQDKVVSKWKDAHPELKTEDIKVSEPKTIFVNVEKLIPDTGYRKKYRDSVLASQKPPTNCLEAQKEAYDLGFDVAEQEYLKNKQKVICPPDTTRTLFMQNEINRQKDTSNNLRIQIGYYKGINDTRIETIQTLNKQLEKRNWLLILCAVIIVLLTYFSLKSFITKIPGMVTGAIANIKS